MRHPSGFTFQAVIIEHRIFWSERREPMHLADHLLLSLESRSTQQR